MGSNLNVVSTFRSERLPVTEWRARGRSPGRARDGPPGRPPRGLDHRIIGPIRSEGPRRGLTESPEPVIPARPPRESEGLPGRPTQPGARSDSASDESRVRAESPRRAGRAPAGAAASQTIGAVTRARGYGK
eukprot:767945-Hanusia_phi.AAC.19